MKNAVQMESVSPDYSANEELTRYLLGEMSEEEQMELEVHYFGDRQMFAELCAWRNDLIDAYVFGQLPPSLRIRFESAIEQSWAMNERIRFAETLQQAVEARGANTASHSRRRSLQVFFANNRKPLVAVALIFVVLAAAWLILHFLD